MLQIGTRTAEQERDAKALARKEQLLQDAIKLCSDYVTISDVEEFKKAPLDVFIQLFKVQHKKIYSSPLITDEKALEIASFPTHILKTINAEYLKIQVEENTDYGIYISDPEKVAEWNELADLCSRLNSLKTKKHLGLGNIVQGMAGFVLFDFSTQTFKPNTLPFMEGYNRI